MLFAESRKPQGCEDKLVTFHDLLFDQHEQDKNRAISRNQVIVKSLLFVSTSDGVPGAMCSGKSRRPTSRWIPSASGLGGVLP
jgi:hypothetical protein